MATRDDIARSVLDLGPAMDDVAAILETAEGTWVVRFADHDVEFELAQDAATLSVQTAVGEVPRDLRADVYDTLLKYNLLRRDTGIVMALAPDGAVVQMLDMPAAEAVEGRLAAIVENFVTRARIWARYVKSGNRDAKQTMETLSFGGIRV